MKEAIIRGKKETTFSLLLLQPLRILLYVRWSCTASGHGSKGALMARVDDQKILNYSSLLSYPQSAELRIHSMCASSLKTPITFKIPHEKKPSDFTVMPVCTRLQVCGFT